MSSRHPEAVDMSLRNVIPDEKLFPPCPVDITEPTSLVPAFKDANVIVSLVGVMHGSQKAFEDVQWRGAENVATAAKNVGAKLIHISAIGADVNSDIPYARTKGLAEKSVFQICPDATILRPSIVFGPQDDFFNVRVCGACRSEWLNYLWLSEVFEAVKILAFPARVWRRHLSCSARICR